jgi:hypothetical protein
VRISSSSVHCAARSIVLAFGLITTVYVTIPDYGWQYSLFYNLGYDPTGWLHEVFYIWAFVAAIVFSSILWQALQTWRNVGILLGGVLKRLEKDL